MPAVRRAAVAGTFYPAEADVLRREVGRLLDNVAAADDAPVPKAIIAPHAGYVYSGPVAASVYARLRAARDVIRRVILLGPVHRVAVRGLALPDVEAFSTPLGTIPLDRAAIERIAALPYMVVSNAPHAPEHSLEVHLPFLQSVLGEFTLVPLAVGDATPEQVAEVLDALWGGDETLVVVSSDLSHYQPYARAVEIDRATVESIVGLRVGIDHRQACGGTPVNGLMLVAKRLGLEPELIDLRNSGDTAGDRVRVVGYASLAFNDRREPQARAASDDAHARGVQLLGIARAAISTALGRPLQADERGAWLHEPGAVFVTINLSGRLRGCIGSLAAVRPLLEDVKENARGAALRDPRFKPLSADELDITTVEVSLLSPVEPVAFASEVEALAALRPGIDGVVFECDQHRSTFLPQVWKSLADPRDFMANLKQKAGLAPTFWSDRVRLGRYTVSKWSEPELVWTPPIRLQ